MWIRGKIAPHEQFLPFSTIFQHIFLTKGVKLHDYLWNLVVRLVLSSILHIWYVEVRISQSVAEGPFDFEITRVACICSPLNKCSQKTTIESNIYSLWNIDASPANADMFHRIRNSFSVSNWHLMLVLTSRSISLHHFREERRMADSSKYIKFNNIKLKIQSTLVISTSVISNNRLSRRENLVPVLTQKSNIRLQNVVERRINCSWGAISPLFHNIFNIYF